MTNGDDETTDPDPSDAVARLQNEHTKDELQELARDEGLKVSGRKAEIAERLVEAGVASDGATGDGTAADGEDAPEAEQPTTGEETPGDETEADADGEADESEGTEPGSEAAAADEADIEATDAEGDDEEGEAEDEAEDTDLVGLGAEEIDERLDTVEADIEAAETEADLDEVELVIEAVAEAIEALPDAEEDADEDPKADLTDRLTAVREALEEQRGPYGSDVVEAVETAVSTLTDSEWTDTGEADAVAAVEAFVESVNEVLETSLTVGNEADPADLAGAATTLDEVGEAVEAAALDADEDAESLAELVAAAGTLADDLEAAEVWDDLTIQQKLTAIGFYDPLTARNRKDFPPELSVVRIAEADRDPEPILTALEYLTSDFMQENCMMALKRLGAPAAFEEMHQRAQKRKELPIQVLGKIGDERALETLHPFVEGDSNPTLQRVVLKTIGEIGSEASTQHVADRLVATEEDVRSAAARALGRIGDPRGVDPLTDVLADDEDDSVRASAAWALVQIGTETALETAAEYVDDRSYIVTVEAEKARRALAPPEQTA